MADAKDLELRDWLAGQALTGILMSRSTPRAGESPLEEHAASLAEQAYAYADAMLRERGKPPSATHAVPGEDRPTDRPGGNR